MYKKGPHITEMCFSLLEYNSFLSKLSINTAVWVVWLWFSFKTIYSVKKKIQQHSCPMLDKNYILNM